MIVSVYKVDTIIDYKFYNDTIIVSYCIDTIMVWIYTDTCDLSQCFYFSTYGCSLLFFKKEEEVPN